MFHRIRTRMHAFWYNVGWSDWVPYVDGWIPRLAFFVPIVGYLILFNDRVGGVLAFHGLITAEADALLLSAQGRLRLVYFGLVALGLSNLFYRWKRPHVFRFGTDRIQVTRTCLEAFTFQDFLGLHERNRRDGQQTVDGKYYDSEWDGFAEAAQNQGEGTAVVRRNGNWEEAKRQYGSLLRSILSEYFFVYNVSRRGWLTVCILLSTAGYVLLSIPSIDLFMKVLFSTLGVVPSGAA